MITVEEILKSPIRALSWKQPYLWLMYWADKIETRTWPTDYRGLVLMCASKAAYKNWDVFEIAGEAQYRRIMYAKPKCPAPFQKNEHALFVGRLTDCRRMTPDDENICFVKYKEPWTEEKKRKDGSIVHVQKELWCHVYTEVTPIVPFIYKGSQKWGKVTEEQRKQIKLIT